MSSACRVAYSGLSTPLDRAADTICGDPVVRPAPFVKPENFISPYKFNVVFGILLQCQLLQMKFDINVTPVPRSQCREERGQTYASALVLIAPASLVTVLALYLVISFSCWAVKLLFPQGLSKSRARFDLDRTRDGLTVPGIAIASNRALAGDSPRRAPSISRAAVRVLIRFFCERRAPRREGRIALFPRATSAS